MAQFDIIIQTLEEKARNVLSDWPPEWRGFHWPGYTYEHTLRVRNLAIAMARQVGADLEVVEMAALLHDIGKPVDGPHGDIGAQRAQAVLKDLCIDGPIRSRVCDLVRTHLAPDPAYPVENLVLSDADYIDANFGYVALTRYITIRAGRGATVEETIAGASGWLVRVSDRRQKVMTDLGQAITEERFGRMAPFLDHLCAGQEGETVESRAAVGIARYLSADACRPSLCRQVDQIGHVLEGTHAIDGLGPSHYLRHFVRTLREEIAGER
jgi:uncharacterized protein